MILYNIIAILVIIAGGILTDLAERKYYHKPLFGYWSKIINLSSLLCFSIGVFMGLTIVYSGLNVIVGLIIYTFSYLGSKTIFYEIR